MNNMRIISTLFLLACATAPGEAQFSSDIPGVPRAAVPFSGGHQNRTEWTFAGYRIPTGADAGDTTALGMRLSYGRSYRLFTRFELGFDVTLVDGLYVRSPVDTLPGGAVTGSYPRGVTLYGLRIGGKFRPFAALDPDGYGFQTAIGAAIQPGLKPVFGVERFADSTRTGGQLAKETEDTDGLTGRDPFASSRTATFLSGMASYRSRRILADAALVVEAVADPDEEGFSPLVNYDGLSPRLGLVVRLTPGLALGGSYWGKGAPPWRDQISVGLPGAAKEESYGVIVSFGSRPESGTDIMLSSPTGDWGQSLRLYIRGRSTR